MSTTENKLSQLKLLMGYFELVGIEGEKWILRNGTDEGLRGRDEFVDTNLDILLDRAVSYYFEGPRNDITAAAREVSAIFNRETNIRGDIICIMYDYINESQELIDGLETLIAGLNHQYKNYELSLTFKEKSRQILPINNKA